MMKGTDSTPVENESEIEVFTTRPDTIFGASFITLAPEHEIVDKITTDEYRVAVQEYVAYAKNRSVRERMADVKKITGQFTGAYAIHPFSRKQIPIWIGEYVLGTYGTGAVMGVPGHDARDNAFAKHFGLPVIHVIIPEKTAPPEPDSYYDVKDGFCINSFFLNGLHVKEAIKKAIEEIEKDGFGKRRINYRMRDAIFGRQRYWGEPIPVYYDEEGIPHTIDEDDLPLVLPEVDKYLPTESGEPPLARAKNWVYSPRSRPSLTPSKGPIPAFPKGEGEGSRASEHYETANKKNYNILKGYGRRLKDEMTDAEKLLWEHLRHNKQGCHFRRQHIVGNFIADFLCLKERLIIEVDGPVHDYQKEEDKGREEELKNLGFKIIRFSNEEVIDNTEAVLQKIREEIKVRKASLHNKDQQEGTLGKVSQENSDLQEETSHEAHDKSHPGDKISAEVPPRRREVSPTGGDLEGAYTPKAYPLELTTMPGWAGSSWYYLRYEDPDNDDAFTSKEAIDYWRNVDFYLGGDEHATGHLLYFRFWTKFLFDRGWIPFDEPAKKLLNQGKIQGISHIVARETSAEIKREDGDKNSENSESLGPISFQYVSFDLLQNPEEHFQFVYAPLEFCKDDKLNVEKFKNWIGATERDQFIFNSKNEFITKSFAEKMSKSKYNVVNPDEVVGEYGADAFRMYEMFLGPIEQHKPWDTKGIDGVYRFLKKLWRLFYDEKGNWLVTTEIATNDELKVLHKTIKKVEEDIERLSFNTSVSAFMICVNELTQMNSHKIELIQPLLIILSPYAPFTTEYLWGKLDNEISIVHASFPKYDASLLEENAFEYPIAINGKTRAKLNLPLDLTQEQIEKEVLSYDPLQKYFDGKKPKKIIVVKGRMINVVV
jgi:leucyl-tRNA synthetase/very-short-patch-repair endonuclease